MLGLRAVSRSKSSCDHNTCQQRGRKRGRHARHQLDGHACCGQRAQLAADARQDGWAAALQAHHPSPLRAQRVPKCRISVGPGHAG